MADPTENQDSFQTAVQQQGDRAWPIPGDEGYVHPDGTPMSELQRANNERAAADRAAAGSIIHGAPMATPGPQMQEEFGKARARAEEDSAVTPDEAREGHAEFVRKGFERAEERAAAVAETEEPREAKPAPARTATTNAGKTTR